MATPNPKPDTFTQAITECYSCRHMRPIPGDCHIACARPLPGMVADPHGVARGWFCYPYNFDPTWKRVLCGHHEPRAIPVADKPLAG